MANIDMFMVAGDSLPAVDTTLTDSTGAPIDLTSATGVAFHMALAGSDVLTVDSPAAMSDTPTDGTVTYSWDDTDTSVPGTYLASFVVSYPGGNQTFPTEGYLSILVQPNLTDAQPAIAPFASPADVQKVTGQSCDDSALAVAWSILEVVAGRPLYELTVPDTDVLTVRDQYYLRAAICWQAVWITANPDFFSSYDTTNMNQSGQSATFNQDGLVVAPLARRALSRITWIKSRSVKIARPIPWYRFMDPSRHDDLGQGTWRGM
jgi:hypothetical protein